MNLDSPSFKKLKRSGLLVLIFVLILFSYYYFWVERKTSYLISRNFRLLATIGLQIDASIANHARILESFVRAPERIAEAKDIVPSLESFKAIDSGSLKSQAPPHSGIWTSIPFSERDSHGEWLQILFFREHEGPARFRARLRLQQILDEIFRRVFQKAVFDVVLLAKTDGSVLFQTGGPELRLTRLDKVVDTEASKEKKRPSFEALSRSTNVAAVNISGTDYQLFIQPCCSSMRTQERSPQSSEQKDDRGWAVCGLVAQEKFTYSSLAISFSIMALISAALLFAIFSWPFLKLTLIGTQHRVRVIDVLLLGICSLLGISLATIFWLDLLAYTKLRGDMDEQLKGLSKTIQDNMKKEIQLAYHQLTDLEREGVKVGKAFSLQGMHFKSYPFFESISFINSDGLQVIKRALQRDPTPEIVVKDRQYFKEAKAGGSWPLPSREPGRYVLESIRSWTTGKEQAVIAKRMEREFSVAALSIPMLALVKPTILPGFGFAIIDDRGTVLFHSDSQRNLLENFFDETGQNRQLRAAIIARRAKLVTMRYWGQDHRAYITPIEELPEVPWFLVSFYDKQLTRTLNVEWLVATILFLVIYVGFYVLFGLGIALSRPAYRAAWIWPDPLRVKEYRRLSFVYLLLLFPFFGSISILRDLPLLVTAWLLPFVAWIVTYLKLTASDSRRGLKRLFMTVVGLLLIFVLFSMLLLHGGLWGAVIALVLGVACSFAFIRLRTELPLPASYSIAGVMLVLLTTVVPTIAFFKTAYGIQIDTFIKHGQLKLALALEDRWKRAMDGYSNEEEKDRVREGKRLVDRDSLDLYYHFFFETKFDTASPESLEGRKEKNPNDSLPEFLEAALPYYSELSVEMRELQHDDSTDLAWSWRRTGNALELHKKTYLDGQALIIQSRVPRPIEAVWPSSESMASYLLLVMMVVTILLLLAWVVRFICRRIFLLDLIAPIWLDRHSGKLQDIIGNNLFLLCRKEQLKANLLQGGNRVDFVDLDKADSSGDRWLLLVSDAMDQVEPGEKVLVDHFEHRIHDKAFNDRKLALLEELVYVHNRTVVVVSSTNPAFLLARNECASTDGKPARSASATVERWTELLSSFSLIDVDRCCLEGKLKEDEIADNSQTQPAASKSSEDFGTNHIAPQGAEARHAWREGIRSYLNRLKTPKLLAEEYREDRFLRRIWKELEPLTIDSHSGVGLNRRALDAEQLIEEIDDRAANYYRGLWASCTPSEKVALEHLAEEGLVNEKDRKILRRLMARGFIQRNPNFRLMNESFCRFVLSAHCRHEVAVFEGTMASTWDSVKWPFLAVLVASVAFFFTTQQELFDATVATITGMAAGLPALVKVMSFFHEKRLGGTERQ